MQRHPQPQCIGQRCRWCFPGPGLSRVELTVVATVDMAELRRELGIDQKLAHYNDAKQWLEDDLNVLVSKLPYLSHMFGIEINAKGLRRR